VMRKEIKPNALLPGSEKRQLASPIPSRGTTDWSFPMGSLLVGLSSPDRPENLWSKSSRAKFDQARGAKRTRPTAKKKAVPDSGGGNGERGKLIL